MAADQYLLAGDAGAARQAFEEVNRRRLAGADVARHDLLAATFLGDADPVAALSRLGATPSNLPEDLRVRWHAMRADLLERAGRPFDAAAELALLASIQDRDARSESTRRIESLLADASDADLARGSAALRPGHPLYPHAARALTRRGLALPRPLERGESFAGLDQLPPADADGYRPPTRLGVLLPLSGPLATAGQSVRDGILAGYYGESRRRPEIQFYDTAGHAGGVRSAIARARDEGAQMLLGPLTREEVGAVFSSIDVDVPVIALNRVPGTPPPGSTTFALAPEEEGVAAADRLADRGFRNVLVVSQNDDGAMRALNAFRQRFAERGGSVAGDARVSEDQPDYLPTLQRAMAGMRPDALFLALKAPAAREPVRRRGGIGRSRQAPARDPRGAGVAGGPAALRRGAVPVRCRFGIGGRWRAGDRVDRRGVRRGRRLAIVAVQRPHGSRTGEGRWASPCARACASSDWRIRCCRAASSRCSRSSRTGQ